MHKNNKVIVPLVKNNKYKEDLWYLMCAFVQCPESLTKKDIRKLKFRGVLLKAPMNPFDIKNILSKKDQTVGISTKACAWCGCHTVVLHDHHFPVQKCKGGGETVAICPNCHADHYLMDTHYKLKEGIEDYYNWAMNKLR